MVGWKPTKPGFYWTRWMTAVAGTHEGHELTPATAWEIVEVWDNGVPGFCPDDDPERFGVSVCGVRETQWLHNFIWLEAEPLEQP